LAKANLLAAVGWVGAAGAAIAFVLLALRPENGTAALFAAAYLALAAGACCGPFLSPRGTLAFLGAAMLLCCSVAWARPASFLLALQVAGFAALFAATGAALAGAIRVDFVRPLIALAGLALLTTFFYWDNAFLLTAADRKASASLAFHLNPAAAVSVLLDFDWMHAKALYTNNQTAESIFGVPLSGAYSYAGKMAALCVPAAAIAFWRQRA